MFRLLRSCKPKLLLEVTPLSWNGSSPCFLSLGPWSWPPQIVRPRTCHLTKGLQVTGCNCPVDLLSLFLSLHCPCILDWQELFLLPYTMLCFPSRRFSTYVLTAKVLEWIEPAALFAIHSNAWSLLQSALHRHFVVYISPTMASMAYSRS